MCIRDSIQPGPFQAFLLSLVARYGWRRAMPAVLAPLVSDPPIVAIVLLVLTRLPEQFLAALRVAGGLFLLFLAWGDVYKRQVYHNRPRHLHLADY